jgi:hypothetical protein
MNCKNGDIAVIVRVDRRTEHLLGVIVRVLERRTRAGLPGGKAYTHMAWLVELPRPMANCTGEISARQRCPDSCLRPIRDNPGEDETLQWADLPQGVTA